MEMLKRVGFCVVAISCVASKTSLAACNATVNGRPMTAEECAFNREIYGQVVPGDYLLDGNGNWVNINNPMHRGNIYQDAQRGYGQGSGDSGMECGTFGCVGGGYYYDPETGASVGSD